MTSKSIFFYLEEDEKKELYESAETLGIKPSELARRRYREGTRRESEKASSANMETLLRLCSFQYAALESIAKSKEDKYEEILERGSTLFDEAMSRQDRH